MKNISVSLCGYSFAFSVHAQSVGISATGTQQTAAPCLM